MNIFSVHRTPILIILGLIFVQGGVLFFFGQPSICSCGYVKIWEGVVLSSGNSQHLTDLYTFSHIIHGFLFYMILWWLFPRMSFWQRLALAALIEGAWEIVENTPWVIDQYRKQALAQGYVGDSIINSISDTVAMCLGFIAAQKFPVWLTVTVALLFEIGVGYYIHDNLTLNVLNLIHPFDFIRDWQAR